jgi:drug/metabolite transporter (DMT)-like permease
LSLKTIDWKLPTIVLPFFLWGTAMVAMKGTLSHTTPLFLASVRLLPAGFLVLLAAWYLKRPLPRSWQAWAWIVSFAIVDGTCFQGFLAVGLTRTTAGLGSVTIDSQPLVVAVLSAWLFGERIGWIGIGGLLLGVVGIAIVGLPVEWWQGNFLLADFSTHGEWLMFLAALSMATGTILMPFVSRLVDPIVATGWHMIIGAIPLAIASGMWESDSWQQLTMENWLSLGYATVFGSAIAYGIFFYYAAQGNLTSLSALTFLTPIFALLFGNLILGETLTSWQLGGVLLTLASISLIESREAIVSFLSFNVTETSENTSALPTQSLEESTTAVPIAIGKGDK